MGYHGVFIFSLILNIFVFIFGLIGLRNVNDKFEQKLKVADILKKNATDTLRLAKCKICKKDYYSE